MKSLFLTFLCLYTLSASMAQNVKPAFKELEIAYYEKDQKGNLSVRYYIKIDNVARINLIDQWPAGTKYFSYILPDTAVQILNAVFDGKRTLGSYKVKDKLEKGLFYAGDYCFASLRGTNDKVDYLTYIDPFMNKFYNAAVEIIWLTAAKLRKEDSRKPEINKEFMSNLQKHHKEAKNLPEKLSPPAQQPPGQ